MASGAGKSAAFALLILNVILYFIVTVISAWAVNHGIERARETGISLQVFPSSNGLFNVYHPIFYTILGAFFWSDRLLYSLIHSIIYFLY